MVLQRREVACAVAAAACRCCLGCGRLRLLAWQRGHLQQRGQQRVDN